MKKKQIPKNQKLEARSKSSEKSHFLLLASCFLSFYHFIILSLCILLFASWDLYAASSNKIHSLAGTTIFNFLKIEEDAYFSRLGEIKTGFKEREGLTLTNAFWFQNLKIAGLKFKQDKYFLRFLNFYVPSEIEKRSGILENDPYSPFTSPEGKFSARSSLLQFGYNYKRWKVNLKLMEERIDEYFARGFCFDVYFREKNFTILLENLGPASKFKSKYYNLPLTLRIGSYKNFKNFEVFYELKKPIDDYLWLNLSLNYAVVPYLHLSFGYSYRFYGNNLGFFNGFNFGFGFGIKKIYFDYSYRNFGILGDTHRFSLRWKFGKILKKVKKQKKEEKLKTKLAGLDERGKISFYEYVPEISEIKKITFLKYGMVKDLKIEVKKEEAEENYNIEGKIFYKFSVKHNVPQILGFVNYYFDSSAIDKDLKAYFFKEKRTYELKLKNGEIVLEAPYLDDFVLYKGKIVKKEAWEYNEMGLKKLKEGNYEEAEKFFKKALSIENSPYFHNNLGTVYIKMEKYEEALKEFEAALKLKPDYRRAKRNLRAVKRILGIK